MYGATQIIKREVMYIGLSQIPIKTQINKFDSMQIISNITLLIPLKYITLLR